MAPHCVDGSAPVNLVLDTTVSDDKALDGTEDASHAGYFDLEYARDDDSEGHSPETPMSMRLPPTPSVTETAFTALQYLPMPVLVLSSEKNIIIANEALGRLLGVDLQQSVAKQEDYVQENQNVMSATDVLHGVSMGALGMDLLQNATPVWISWDDFLESVRQDAISAFDAEHCAHDGGDITPTASSHADPKASPKPAPLTRANLARTTVHDVAVDVVFSTSRDPQNGLPISSRAEGNHTPLTYEMGSHIQSTVIISVWTVDDAQYYTLTFTSATDVKASKSRASQRIVARTTPQASYASGLGSGSSTSSNGRRTHNSNRSSTTSSPSIHPPALLPNGPPALAVGTAEPSLFSKANRLKDALLNSLNDPAFAMWKDESFGIPNKAAVRMIQPDNEDGIIGVRDQRDFLAKYVLWMGDFSGRLPMSEFPIMHLMTEKKRFKARRLGMYHPTSGAKVLYDVDGEPILDERTGEFLGGIVIFHDVTEYANTITAQQVQNERQFESITNMIPQMIWTTTPSGQHDYYSQRWYEFTGLSVEQSLGDGWRNPFHPDDMTLTAQR